MKSEELPEEESFSAGFDVDLFGVRLNCLAKIRYLCASLKNRNDFS